MPLLITFVWKPLDYIPEIVKSKSKYFKKLLSNNDLAYLSMVKLLYCNNLLEVFLNYNVISNNVGF